VPPQSQIDELSAPPWASHFQYLAYLIWLRCSMGRSTVNVKVMWLKGSITYLRIAMYAIGWPTARFYLVRVQSPEFQLLLEERSTHVSWIVQFSSSENINKLLNYLVLHLGLIFYPPKWNKLLSPTLRNYFTNLNTTLLNQILQVFVPKLFKLEMHSIPLRHSN